MIWSCLVQMQTKMPRADTKKGNIKLYQFSPSWLLWIVVDHENEQSIQQRIKVFTRKLLLVEPVIQGLTQHMWPLKRTEEIGAHASYVTNCHITWSITEQRFHWQFKRTIFPNVICDCGWVLRIICEIVNNFPARSAPTSAACSTVVSFTCQKTSLSLLLLLCICLYPPFRIGQLSTHLDLYVKTYQDLESRIQSPPSLFLYDIYEKKGQTVAQKALGKKLSIEIEVRYIAVCYCRVEVKIFNVMRKPEYKWRWLRFKKMKNSVKCATRLKSKRCTNKYATKSPTPEAAQK